MEYSNLPVMYDSESGVRYYNNLKYPEIPRSETDVYIITVIGHRLDVLSDHYYSNTGDSWIISTANGLSGDSMFFTPGTHLRIPTNTTTVKNDFNTLNNL